MTSYYDLKKILEKDKNYNEFELEKYLQKYKKEFFFLKNLKLYDVSPLLDYRSILLEKRELVNFNIQLTKENLEMLFLEPFSNIDYISFCKKIKKTDLTIEEIYNIVKIKKCRAIYVFSKYLGKWKSK